MEAGTYGKYILDRFHESHTLRTELLKDCTFFWTGVIVILCAGGGALCWIGRFARLHKASRTLNNGIKIKVQSNSHHISKLQAPPTGSIRFLESTYL